MLTIKTCGIKELTVQITEITHISVGLNTPESEIFYQLTPIFKICDQKYELHSFLSVSDTAINIIQTALEVIKEAIRNIVVTNPGVAYPLRGPSLGRCLTRQFLRNLAIPNVDVCNKFVSQKLPKAWVQVKVGRLTVKAEDKR